MRPAASGDVDWQHLSGAQLAAFQAALLSAYSSRSALEQMLLFKMNARLNQIVEPGNLRDVTAALLTWATDEGRTAELYASARADVPGNPMLKALAGELRRLTAPTSLAQPDAPAAADPAADAARHSTAASRGVSVGGEVSGAIIITGDGNQINLPPGGATFPGPAASTGSSRGALDIWREKLDFLRQQEAITADAAQKFALKKQIAEALAKIQELS